jgi:hypothetical protein
MQVAEGDPRMVDSPAEACRPREHRVCDQGLADLLAMPAKRPFPEQTGTGRSGPEPTFTAPFVPHL